MKLFELIREAADILRDLNTPQLDAEVILSHVMGRDKIYLYMNRNMEIGEDITGEFFSLIERRKNGEPVQYIVGKQEFMALDFLVKPGVLIPRGDTEVLVEEVLKNLKGIISPRVVDVGCGSGAIAVSIAKYRPDARVYALDLMDTPLEVTGINAERNGVRERVTIIKSDMLTALDRELEGSIDAVVSNPPYIRQEVIPTLMREVRDFEPHTALSGGMDGLHFYREITRESRFFIKPRGFIAYEIGFDQREDVMNMLKENEFCDVYSVRDLAGHDRVVTGWRK